VSGARRPLRVVLFGDGESPHLLKWARALAPRVQLWALSSRSFDVGRIRVTPGYLSKNDTGSPDLALFVNSVALVDVAIGPDVHVVVTHLAGQDRHVYRYTSGPGYMIGDSPGVPGRHGSGSSGIDKASVKEIAGPVHPGPRAHPAQHASLARAASPAPRAPWLGQPEEMT